MKKEIVYYGDKSKIFICQNDTNVCISVGDDDNARYVELEKDAIQDLITTLADIYIKIKDK